MPSRPALLVSELYPPAIGGSGVLLENVYARLQDIAVTVLASGERPDVERRGSLLVRRVDMTAPDWGIVRPASARRHLSVARAIRRWSPPGTVVHCARGLPEGLSARLAQLSTGAPYVCWTHGEELGFSSTSRELTLLLRRVYRRAAAVVANSRNSARLLAGWGVHADRVHVIHPGVDANRFRPDVDCRALRQRLAPNGEVLLLSVGRLQRRKGHDLALQALALMRRDFGSVRYVIAGDGPDRSVLEDLARSVGISDIVSFEGAVSEDELPAYYAACDVFLLPNREDDVDFEGFGIVFLEAAAAGKPVIAGRSGGVPEAVEDGVTGRLVSGTDPEELCRVMCELAADEDHRARLGNAALERVRCRFTWERAAAGAAAVHELVSARVKAGSGR